MSKNTDQPRTPRRYRLILLAAVVVLALPVLGAALLLASFNPNRYAPQIIAAVEQATGRPLTIGGPIRLRLSFSPVIEARQLSLANPPGFPDADLVTLDRVEAQLALLPLLSHRIDILHLHLVGPNIVLERNAAGTPDWIFAPAPAPAGASATPMPTPGTKPAGAAQNYKIALQQVDVSHGLLTLKSQNGTPTIISLPSLTGTAESLTAPLHLQAQAAIGATPFTVAGTVGPIARLSGIGTGPWPVDLSFALADASAHVAGNIAHPRTAAGYDLNVTANIPSLAGLAASLPTDWTGGIALPPVQNITAAARIVDQNSPVPAIDNLAIKSGSADLSALRPGLTLQNLDVEMASLDKPLALSAAGTLNGTALSLSGNFGPPQALLPRAWLPASMPPQVNYPITAQANFGNASAKVSGAIASPETLSGTALALNATIPDLSLLSPLSFSPLPAWKNIAAQATLVDPGGQGLRSAIGLQGLAVSMDNAAFGGDASLYLGKTPTLQAALTASQINLDALLQALPHPTPPPAQAPAAATPPGTPAAPAHLLRDIKLPLALLHDGNADLQLTADSLLWNRASYAALQAHAVLNNGVLTINPVTGQLPGGSVAASAVIDAAKNPATETLHISAPALALAPFLRAFSLPNTAQGTLQAQLNASGSGNSLAPIAASLNGQLGLAMVNGVVDGAVLNRLFGTVLHTLNLPANLTGAQGPVAVRCMATRLDASNGTGTFRALALDSSRMKLEGGGTVNFSTETLGLVLRPQMRVGGTTVDVPVQVGGSFAAPTTSVASKSAVQAAAQNAAGLAGGAPSLFGQNTLLGQIVGDLGLDNTSSADICPAALTLARMGQPGPAPAAANAPAAAPAAPAGPTNLLNAILGK